MESAFGVEHGEISKGLKLPHRAALGRMASDAPAGAGGYARNRLASRYQSVNRKIKGSDYKEKGKAYKDLANSYAADTGKVGRLRRKLP
jgi:hypothetical protein